MKLNREEIQTYVVYTNYCTMLVFLAINGIDLKYTDTELIELILSVASGTQSDSDILQWLQQHII